MAVIVKKTFNEPDEVQNPKEKMKKDKHVCLLGWQERQKVVVKLFGKDKIVITDWKKRAKL